MPKSYIILEAYTAQGQALKRLLKKHTQNKIITTNKTRSTLENSVHVIPSGANSTWEYLVNKKSIESLILKFDKGNLVTFDKPRMLSIVESLKIPIPNSYKSKEEIDSYPVFYKSNFETGDKIRGIVNSENELNRIPDNNCIIQEYIKSDKTYGIAFLAKNGELLTHFSQVELLSNPPTGGAGIVLEEIHDEKILNYSVKIIKEISYTGWGLAEYKYCPKRKDFVFMEINAKFWSSLQFALINEPQFAKLLFGISLNKQNCKRIMFLDQLVQSSFLNVLKGLVYIFSSKLTWQSNVSYLFYDRIKSKFIRLFKA